MGNVRYTNYSNAVEDYMAMATKLKISAETNTPDASGNFQIRQKNGPMLIPTLQEIFSAEYAKNPQLQEIYAVDSYVRRKKMDRSTCK